MPEAKLMPFLESATVVLEQLLSIRPVQESPATVTIHILAEHSVWLSLRLKGSFEADVYYSFPQTVALKLVSRMMGGMEISELDELGASALSELGNMISGNASTLLSMRGMEVDISTPRFITTAEASEWTPISATSAPLSLDGIGSFQIFFCQL